VTRRAAGVLCFLLLCVAPAAGQERPAAVEERVPGLAERVLLPHLFSDVYALRAAIVALGDSLPGTRAAHLERIDRIYLEAVRIAEGDPMHALLLCSIATLPYWKFPAYVPLAGWVINVPVSTETHAEFLARLSCLPSMLLEDSRPGQDRDKLPHFFGSAWLQCVLRSRSLVDLVGRLVEAAESVFKLEGARDPRDLDAGRLGAAFGDTLGGDEDALPSRVLCSQRPRE
jgi:hypothetical protein